MDAGIGILAEPKPAGFALGFTQLYQFVLNAPRRVKSNRHLTEYYTLKDYRPEGIAWVEHSGGMLGVMARHLRGLPQGAAVVAAMEGVTRAFAPWPTPSSSRSRPSSRRPPPRPRSSRGTCARWAWASWPPPPPS